MSFALYDSNGKIAQISTAFDIIFVPNVIQGTTIAFTPETYAMSSKLTIAFTTNVAYAAGSYFKVTTPIDFTKTTTLTCSVTLGGAATSCSNSAGRPTITQMLSHLTM